MASSSIGGHRYGTGDGSVDPEWQVFFVFNLSAYARQVAPIRRSFPGIFFAG